MPTCNTRIAIGSRAQLSFGEERCYGIPVPPTKRIDFVSESIQNNITKLVSNALNPQRAVTNVVRGTSDIAGDIAYEQNTNGFGVFYKHALGDVITLELTDGGIGAQMAANASSGATSLTLRANNVNASWPTTGKATIVSRNSSGNLESDAFTWTGKTDGTSLTGVSGLAIDVVEGDRLFLTDSTNYVGVYTHYYECGATLPTGMTIEPGRDVVFFTYTGMKVNQLTENFNAQEFLTGTFSLIGRAEASGAVAQKAIVAGDSTVMLRVGSYIIQDGTGIAGFRQRNAAGTMLGSNTYKLQIEDDNDVTYTSITLNANGSAVLFGIPTSGTGSIPNAHAAGVPVAPQSTAAQTALTPPTTEPLVSFQAGVYLNSSFQEVLTATYTLNNNLFADKFQLGDRYRAQLPEQKREVTGSVSIEFDNLVMYRKFVDSEVSELEIRVVDDGVSGQIGSTGVYRQKNHIFPKCKFEGTTPVVGGPDVITMDMPFQSFYDVEDDEPEMILIIVNDVEREPHAV